MRRPQIKYIADPGMHSIPAVSVHPNGKWLCGQSLDNQVPSHRPRCAGAQGPTARNSIIAAHRIAATACLPPPVLRRIMISRPPGHQASVDKLKALAGVHRGCIVQQSRGQHACWRCCPARAHLLHLPVPREQSLPYQGV